MRTTSCGVMRGEASPAGEADGRGFLGRGCLRREAGSWEPPVTPGLTREEGERSWERTLESWC